jgi:glycosyltransferase involved in cell wall biosynthesis
MSRLALFMTDLAGGGAERVMINLAEGFAARGDSVDLVVVKSTGAYLDALSTSITLVDLSASRLSLALPGLVGYLRRIRPAAMISAMNDANIIAILAACIARVPTRIVVTEHCNPTEEARHAATFKRRLVPRILGFFYNRASRVVAVSKGVESDLHRLGVDPKKTVTIYNPIVTPDFRRQLLSPSDHPWLQVSAVPVMMGIGRLHPQKHFELLIRSYAEVRQTHPIRLMILGEGEDRPKLEKLINALGLKDSVVFPGFVEQTGSYLARAALLVLSSNYEGFGNVLVEALAAGVPVVATDCPSGPSEILTDPRYGQLVPLNDLEAMTAAILDRLSHPPADRAALKEYAENFALERVIEEYARICFE